MLGLIITNKLPDIIIEIKYITYEVTLEIMYAIMLYFSLCNVLLIKIPYIRYKTIITFNR